MKKKISFIGGDLRSVYLAELWANEEFEIYTYGLEETNYLEKNTLVKKCITLEECIKASQVIISAIPFSKDDIFVNSVFGKNKIKIDEIAQYIENKIFIAGNISKKFYELIENKKSVKIFDLMKSEELAILNSIATAEGAIKIAIEETVQTIHGRNILILGFGRIGKVLAKILDGMEAKVYCAARKQEDLAWIETYGYEPVALNELNKYLDKFDIIFNTIPYIILDKSKLILLKNKIIIIDLASKPGGVDKAEADKLNLRTIWALALPGKIAPKSAAQIIKRTIEYELFM